MRVSALESAYNNLFQYTLPYWEGKVNELERQMADVLDRLSTVEEEISGGSGGESLLDKITDLIDSLANLKTGNKKLITILMSYANLKLLSPKNPTADSALWTNLNALVGE